jgi:hypothetical protein
MCRRCLGIHGRDLGWLTDGSGTSDHTTTVMTECHSYSITLSRAVPAQTPDFSSVIPRPGLRLGSLGILFPEPGACQLDISLFVGVPLLLGPRPCRPVDALALLTDSRGGQPCIFVSGERCEPVEHREESSGSMPRPDHGPRSIDRQSGSQFPDGLGEKRSRCLYLKHITPDRSLPPYSLESNRRHYEYEFLGPADRPSSSSISCPSPPSSVFSIGNHASHSEVRPNHGGAIRSLQDAAGLGGGEQGSPHPDCNGDHDCYRLPFRCGEDL